MKFDQLPLACYFCKESADTPEDLIAHGVNAHPEEFDEGADSFLYSSTARDAIDGETAEGSPLRLLADKACAGVSETSGEIAADLCRVLWLVRALVQRGAACWRDAEPPERDMAWCEDCGGPHRARRPR